MLKTNFIISIFILILTASCSKNSDKKVVFKFPKIIDQFGNKNLKLTFKNELNNGDHNPYYLGKSHDTLLIERYLNTTTLPLPPPGLTGTIKSNYNQKKGRFDDYFIGWRDVRDFKNTDSINLFIKIDTTQLINSNGRKAFPVLIRNTTTDTIYIGYGNQIPIITEAKSKNGKWTPIEKRHTYFCGTGLLSIILPPNEIVITSELLYSGNFKTKLRIKMGNNYSDEFYGEINESQFKSKWENNRN